MTWWTCRSVRFNSPLGVLGHGKARKVLPGGAGLDLDPQHGRGLLSNRPLHGDGRQRFSVHARDQEALLAIDLGPDLADPNFGPAHRPHVPNLETSATRVNAAKRSGQPAPSPKAILSRKGRPCRRSETRHEPENHFALAHVQRGQRRPQTIVFAARLEKCIIASSIRRACQ